MWPDVRPGLGVEIDLERLTLLGNVLDRPKIAGPALFAVATLDG